ncbi:MULTISPECIES: hypothetical protein [Shewanella]|uniref:hypothetical protein n=1 Tax=Shewanella TaxID=22 RepID=UPI001182D31D|nr:MULTISPECIES: hypothetical protein [Shewanella]QYJ89066.1 hypothetical protein K0H81_14970 [Shewanella halotolerans]TVP14916.1 hypothetical protein AYI87_07980 [Shewanella sp. KCT]
MKEPDYKTYSLAELIEVKANIDKTAYPERYQSLIDEIGLRERHPEREPKRAEETQASPLFLIKILLGFAVLPFSWHLIQAFKTGSITSRGHVVYDLATNPPGFYLIFFWHLAGLIFLIYFICFGKLEEKIE